MYIKISGDLLRFGVDLGYKLSRLEWIWGSTLEMVQKEFEPSKKAILFQLPVENIKIDESDYISFSQSILGYYLRTDISVYSSILIGIAIQRCSLIGVSEDTRENDNLRELAKSALVSIPDKLVSNKEYLFEMIYEHKGEDLFQIMNCLEQMSDENKDCREENIPTLFLSYCSEDSCIADIIEKSLKDKTNNRIKISRDIRVKYKESFKEFMDSIQDHDFVLSLVSGSYLKSLPCMYEVGEIIKDHHFKDKLLFIVLDRNDGKYYLETGKKFVPADIYRDAKSRLAYSLYWKKEFEELNNMIKEIDDNEAAIRSSEELRKMGKIYRNDISEFLSYLNEHRGKSFDELYKDDFSDIIKWIFAD